MSVSNFFHKTVPRKILPVPHKPSFSVGHRTDSNSESKSKSKSKSSSSSSSSKNTTIMSGYQDKCITLWRRGVSKAEIVNNENELKNASDGTRFGLERNYSKILELKTAGMGLCDAKISPDAHWLAASDTQRGRLWRIVSNKDIGEGYRLLPSGVSLPGFGTVRFIASTSDLESESASCLMICGTLATGHVDVYDLTTDNSDAGADANKNGIKRVASLSTHLHNRAVGTYRSAIRTLEVSADGNWLCCGDSNSIHIYKRNLNGFDYHGELPRMDTPHSAIGFHPGKAADVKSNGKKNNSRNSDPNPSVVVSLADNRFFVFKAKSLRMSAWSQDYSSSLPQHLLHHPTKFTQISFDPSKPSKMFLISSSAVCLVDLNSAAPETSDDEHPAGGSGKQKGSLKKKKKRAQKEERDRARKRLRTASITVDMGDGNNDNSQSTPKAKSSWETAPNNQENFKMLRRFKPLHFFGLIGNNTMVAVETPWLDVISKLPPPVYKHKYGT